MLLRDPVKVDRKEEKEEEGGVCVRCCCNCSRVSAGVDSARRSGVLGTGVAGWVLLLEDASPSEK